MRPFRFLFLVFTLLLVTTFPLAAQSAAPFGSSMDTYPPPNGPTELRTFGTQDATWHVVNARELQAWSELSGTQIIPGSAWGAISRTGGDPWLLAPLHLPTGALVEGVEWQYCDSNATSAVHGAMYWVNWTTSSYGYFGNYTWGDNAATPGCTVFFQPIDPPVTIDNFNNAYGIEVNLGSAGDNSTGVVAMRVVYKLQVSPAPLSATFADVPVGHALHQFVEAMVSAGITAGCGGGNYCPNAFVTRGQMAVFFAKALGLHWVP